MDLANKYPIVKTVNWRKWYWIGHTREDLMSPEGISRQTRPLFELRTVVTHKKTLR